MTFWANKSAPVLQVGHLQAFLIIVSHWKLYSHIRGRMADQRPSCVWHARFVVPSGVVYGTFQLTHRQSLYHDVLSKQIGPCPASWQVLPFINSGVKFQNARKIVKMQQANSSQPEQRTGQSKLGVPCHRMLYTFICMPNGCKRWNTSRKWLPFPRYRDGPPCLLMRLLDNDNFGWVPDQRFVHWTCLLIAHFCTVGTRVMICSFDRTDCRWIRSVLAILIESHLQPRSQWLPSMEFHIRAFGLDLWGSNQVHCQNTVLCLAQGWMCPLSLAGLSYIVAADTICAFSTDFCPNRRLKNNEVHTQASCVSVCVAFVVCLSIGRGNGKCTIDRRGNCTCQCVATAAIRLLSLFCACS